MPPIRHITTRVAHDVLGAPEATDGLTLCNLSRSIGQLVLDNNIDLTADLRYTNARILDEIAHRGIECMECRARWTYYGSHSDNWRHKRHLARTKRCTT